MKYWGDIMQNNEDFEQQLYQYRYLTEQREMFTRQLEILRASLGNLQNTKLTAENMRDLKEGEEILVPIGGMMNVKAKSTPNITMENRA